MRPSRQALGSSAIRVRSTFRVLRVAASSWLSPPLRVVALSFLQKEVLGRFSTFQRTLTSSVYPVDATRSILQVAIRPNAPNWATSFDAVPFDPAHAGRSLHTSDMFCSRRRASFPRLSKHRYPAALIVAAGQPWSTLEFQTRTAVSGQCRLWGRWNLFRLSARPVNTMCTADASIAEAVATNPANRNRTETEAGVIRRILAGWNYNHAAHLLTHHSSRTHAMLNVANAQPPEEASRPDDGTENPGRIRRPSWSCACAYTAALFLPP